MGLGEEAGIGEGKKLGLREKAGIGGRGWDWGNKETGIGESPGQPPKPDKAAQAPWL